MHSNGSNAYSYNVQMNVHAAIADSSADCCESRDLPHFFHKREQEGGNPFRIEIVFCPAIVRLHREMSPGAISLRPLAWPLSCLDP